MSDTARIRRRSFLKGAAAALALPAIVPEGVIARNGRPGANDRIVIANIGVGGMGRNHVRPDSAALCDVDENHLAEAARRVTQGTPSLYRDYRRVLERRDIDAVIIATPDHWHALMMVHACQAGKHVFCEKPTARTVLEGRAMVNAARHYRRVVQINAQGRSHPNARLACNFVRNGMLGRVRRVDVWHPPNFRPDSWGEPQRVPSTLDWDLWLGPAPWAPYHPKRCHFHFRWFMDYGGGFLRDRGNHALSIVSWLMDNDGYRGRVTVEASGTEFREGFYDVPATLSVKWEFTDPEWTLTWTQPGTPNPRFPGDWGATYRGGRDELVVLAGDGGCEVEQKAKDYSPPPGGFQAFESPGHFQNWLDCIRTGERPVMDVETGHHVVTLCNLGNIAWRLGRKVVFDFAAERFVDDPAADRFLSEPYRSPWTLSGFQENGRETGR